MRRRRQPAMSVMKRNTAWLSLIVAAATTVTVVAASPSFAAGGDISATATASAGWAHFDADNNVLSIYDAHPDGYGVVVVNFRSDLANPGPYYGWNRDGSGSTVHYQLHMPYGASIKFEVCSEKDGLLIGGTCGVRAIGYAGPEI